MPILGAQVSRIEGKRAELTGELKISSNVEIIDVSKKSVNVGEEAKNMLNFHYKFTVTYSENASIIVEGVIYYKDEDKKMDELEAKWKKDKKLGADAILPILNHAMELGYINAIGIADKLRLPVPLKIPHFVPQEKK